MDRQTGRSRGFGFVTFRDPKCVDSVLRGSHTIDGRQVKNNLNGLPLKQLTMKLLFVNLFFNLKKKEKCSALTI